MKKWQIVLLVLVFFLSWQSFGGPAETRENETDATLSPDCSENSLITENMEQTPENGASSSFDEEENSPDEQEYGDECYESSDELPGSPLMTEATYDPDKLSILIEISIGQDGKENISVTNNGYQGELEINVKTGSTGIDENKNTPVNTDGFKDWETGLEPDDGQTDTEDDGNGIIDSTDSDGGAIDDLDNGTDGGLDDNCDDGYDEGADGDWTDSSEDSDSGIDDWDNSSWDDSDRDDSGWDNSDWDGWSTDSDSTDPAEVSGTGRDISNDPGEKGRLAKEIKEKHGIRMLENGGSWSVEALRAINKTLDALPESFKKYTRTMIKAGTVGGIAGWAEVPGSTIWITENAGSPAISTIVHEMTHCFQTNSSVLREWENTFWGGRSGYGGGFRENGSVSAYGNTNPMEDMAESVSQYFTHPQRVKNGWPARYKFIKEKIMNGKEFNGNEWR